MNSQLKELLIIKNVQMACSIKYYKKNYKKTIQKPESNFKNTKEKIQAY